MPVQAVVVDKFEGLDSISLKAHDPGAPGAGEVRVRIVVAGVSYVDVLVAEGLYQLRPPLPFVPGSEFAGVIEAVGDGVDPARIGERVMATAFGLAFAEAAVIPAASAALVPADMDFTTASVFRVSYITAYYALVRRGLLQADESVLVLGAGGAIGVAAVQIAKAFGARVIGSASSEEKRTVAMEAGADAVVDTRSDNWRDAVKAANDGKPVDIVVDPVGGALTEPAFRSLAWNGRHLVIGFASGDIARLPVNLPLLKGAALIGVDARQFGIKEPDSVREDFKALMALHARGALRPHIARTYPLARFKEAMGDAKGGAMAGRIVLTMDD